MLDETQLRKFVRYKKIARNALTKYQWVYDDHLIQLTHFIEHGTNRPDMSICDELANWELVDLRIPETYWEKAAEVSMSQQHQMDYPHLMRSLAYGYIETARAHYGMHHFLARFGRERTGGLDPSDLFRLCLAELAGLEKESRQLFHAFASAYRRRSIIRSKSHIGDFVVLLYARYLGMELAPQVDNFAYQALLEAWDSPDLAKVSALVLFICDEQVRQMLAPPSKFYCEFDNGDYCLLPLTALLVLKLRQNRGLTNPELTHPAFGLLNTMLAPAPLTLHYDELLLAVLQKMQSQGFAIDASYALTR
jgi:hypothetical protein